MAHYDNLPVYKATYDLLLNVYNVTGKVPRDVKFTLIEVIKKDLTDILVLIYRANSSSDKVPLIDSARERIVCVKIRLRLLHDLRHINIKKFALLAGMSEQVSIQLSAWRKYSTDRCEIKGDKRNNQDIKENNNVY